MTVFWVAAMIIPWVRPTHSIGNIIPIQNMRIPEEIVIKSNQTIQVANKGIPVSVTENINQDSMYKALQERTKSVKKRFKKSRILMKKQFKNATKNVVANIKQILVPKYENYQINVTEIVQRDLHPLLVFVNKKSGGHKGALVLKKFKTFLNDYQICDVSSEKPKTYIELYKNIPSERLRILCCGGDGSIQWIMNEFYDANLLNATFGILPLGTGNDLYLYLFGSNSTAAVQKFLDNPIDYINTCVTNNTIPLDRWALTFKNYPTSKLTEMQSNNNITSHPKKSILQNAWRFATKKKRKGILRTMNNYFGVGVDGAISIKFHNARNSMPYFFFSSLINKLWYGVVSLSTLLSGQQLDLNKFMELQCDGKKVNLPRNIQGIVILNINSYAGGSVMWNPLQVQNNMSTKYQYMNVSDGILEIVGVTGVAHLGQIKAGLSSGIEIAQGRRITIKTKEYIPMQIDGEPWLQRPCRINIRLLDRVKVFVPGNFVPNVLKIEELRLQNLAQKAQQIKDDSEESDLLLGTQSFDDFLLFEE